MTRDDSNHRFDDAGFREMLATKHEADARIRRGHYSAWGDFLKCDKCGDWELLCSPGSPCRRQRGCSGVMRRQGYSAPIER
jgi:hypothetical protein